MIGFFRYLMKRRRVPIQDEKVLSAFAKYVTKFYYVANDPAAKQKALEVMKYMHES